MNHGVRTELLVAAAALALGGVARSDDPPAKGAAELQGCWKFESLEIDGKAEAPIGGGQPRWVVKDDKVLYGGEEALRITTDPKVIDLKFRNPERVYEGIYVVEKDTLKVCLHGRGDAKDRPDAFTTKDHADRRLLVFKREKAAPANPTEGLPAFAGIQLRAEADGKGVGVDGTIKGSPAEKAGLKRGDVILKVGGAAVTDLDATVKAVRQAKPGAKLEVLIRRDDKELPVTVMVGVFPLPLSAMLD